MIVALALTVPASSRPRAEGQPKPSAGSRLGEGWLLVANKSDQALGIIDPVAGRQVAAVPENGVTGHEVIASPDGAKAYVPLYGSGGVSKPGTDGQHIIVVDLASRAVEKTFTFSKGVRPHHPVFGPKDGLLYVTTELDNTVTVFDPKTMTVVGTVSTDQPESHMLAISSDGTRGYTANVAPGTVSVLDLVGRKPLAVIPVATHTQRIALSVDDRWAFTSDTTQPRLAVIDTKNNTVSRWIVLPAPGYGAAATPDGRWLVIAVSTANKVAVIDLKTFAVARTIDVPPSPQEVLVRPDGKVAYVSCDVPGKVAAIRTSDWTVEKVIDAGKYADGLAWASAR
ncbi:MAG: beta-propeller fold lactonase family protein [Vicinamibacteria bacterium]|nr:beta-propeller fold lactonase family protein [Vicinamibacteria bacterium]